MFASRLSVIGSATKEAKERGRDQVVNSEAAAKAAYAKWLDEIHVCNLFATWSRFFDLGCGIICTAIGATVIVASGGAPNDIASFAGLIIKRSDTSSAIGGQGQEHWGREPESHSKRALR